MPVSIGSVATKSKVGTGEDQTKSSPSPKTNPEPIEAVEPPDRLEILPNNDEKLEFYPGERKYIRVLTNAADHYHPAHDDKMSRINFYTTHAGYTRAGSTPLKGGRMRLILDLKEEVDPDASSGELVVELQRHGLPLLSIRKRLIIVDKPPAKESKQQLKLPKFNFIALDGPDDEEWQNLEWPDDTKNVAFEPRMSKGELIICYSSVFPEFVQKLKKYEHQDLAESAYFKKRYEIWLAVYSLIEHEKQKKDQEIEEAEEHQEGTMRQGYCNTAALAALFAQRETDMALKRGDK